MAAGPYHLAFWSRRTTAAVLPASSAAQARQRATARRRAGYGNLVSVQQANAADTRLIRRGVWVRRRRDGTSPPVRQCPIPQPRPRPAQPLQALALRPDHKQASS